MSDHPHRALIDSLRTLADFYEAHPDTCAPRSYGAGSEYFETFDRLADRAQELGGEWYGNIEDQYFRLRLVGTPLNLGYYLTCPREQVGEVRPVMVESEDFTFRDDVVAALAQLVTAPDARLPEGV